MTHLILKNTVNHLYEENIKLVKQSEIITYQPKTFENPIIVDIKAVIREYPKISHKLSNTKRQAEHEGSNSFLYRDAKKWKYFEQKKYKNNKKGTCF